MTHANYALDPPGCSALGKRLVMLSFIAPQPAGQRHR